MSPYEVLLKNSCSRISLKVVDKRMKEPANSKNENVSI